MNLVLAGGGMKVSYQVGQAAALVEGVGVPEAIWSVSSGLVTASFVSAYGDSPAAILASYAEHLRSVASRGVLPSVKTSRRLAVQVCANLLGKTRARGIRTMTAVGANRSDFRPTCVDLSSAAPEALEALMSIPLLLDSQSSRELEVIDGGYHHNVPWRFAPATRRTFVLAYFQPSPRHAERFEQLRWARTIERRAIQRAYRHVWAWVNCTFPHQPTERSNLTWFIPKTRRLLSFFSRNLSHHLRALECGYEETRAELARGEAPAISRRTG